MESSPEIKVRINPEAVVSDGHLDAVLGGVRDRISAVSHAYAEERIVVASDPEDPYLLHLTVEPKKTDDPRDRETIIEDLKRNLTAWSVTVE